MRRHNIWLLLTSLLIFSLVHIPSASWPWWEKGHDIICEVALSSLPSDMPEFFTRSLGDIQYFSKQPDRWKSYDRTMLRASEGPNHYMDLERLDPEVKDISLPENRYEAIKLYLNKGWMPDKVGLLPYQIIEYYQRLKGVFAEYRKDPSNVSIQRAAVAYAGILSHYAGDISQPLHLTIHYNGRVDKDGNVISNEGIHFRFEGPLVDDYIESDNVAGFARRPEHFKNVWDEIISMMLRSHGFVDRVYGLDDRGLLENPDKGSKEFVSRRIADGAWFVASLWLTAWTESAE